MCDFRHRRVDFCDMCELSVGSYLVFFRLLLSSAFPVADLPLRCEQQPCFFLTEQVFFGPWGHSSVLITGKILHLDSKVILLSKEVKGLLEICTLLTSKRFLYGGKLFTEGTDIIPELTYARLMN